MPNFYFTNETNGHTCNEILTPVYKYMGLCKSINDYGFRYDEQGNPLIEDC